MSIGGPYIPQLWMTNTVYFCVLSVILIHVCSEITNINEKVRKDVSNKITIYPYHLDITLNLTSM